MVLIRAAIYGDPVTGWPSLVCIILFVSGIQFFFMGALMPKPEGRPGTIQAAAA